MSEYDDISRAYDDEMMKQIDSLLSTPLAHEGHVNASDSFNSFCAQFAAAVPQASDKFRGELLARVLNTLPDQDQAVAVASQASTTEEVSQNGRSPDKRLHTNNNRRLIGVFTDFLYGNRRVLAGKAPQRGRRLGRATSFVLGLTGLVVILAALVGMAAALRIRHDASQDNKTPIAKSVTPVESPKLLSSITSIYALDTVGVQYMAWSPDGRVLATGFGNNVELWDGASGQLLHRIDVNNLGGLWWWPGRSMLVVLGNGVIGLFDEATGQELKQATPNKAVWSPVDNPWSPDGRMIVSPFMNWPVTTPAVLPNVGGGPGSPATALPDVSATPTTIPVGDTPMPGSYDGFLNILDSDTGNVMRTLRMPPLQDNSGRSAIDKFAWSSNGRYLAALYSDRSMGVWDARDGTVKLDIPRTKDGPDTVTDPPRGFEWSPKGHILARLAGMIVEIWDADTGKKVGFLPFPSPPPYQPPTPVPTAIDPLHTPAPAERKVPSAVMTVVGGFTITPAPTVEYVTPTPLPTYVYEDERYRVVQGLAWSPDGHTLATRDENNIRLWDTDTGKQKWHFTGDSAIRKLVWSPDGGVLFSLEGNPSNSHPNIFGMGANEYFFLNGTLKMWDPVTGKQLRSISQDGLSDFLLSPTGKALAVRVGTAVTIWSVDSEMAPRTDSSVTTPSPSPAAPATDTSPIPAIITTPSLPLAITPSPAPASATPKPVCGSWSVMSAASPAAVESGLQSVSALSPNYAWAVGYYSVNGARDQNTNQIKNTETLVMRWDGKRWTQVASPDPGKGDNFLTGVMAVTENDAWAVGYFSGADGLQQALILHWDGERWSQVSIPELTGGNGSANGKTTSDSKLNAVSGSARDDIWAVGTLGKGGYQGSQFTLILHWDGKAWSRVPSPSPGIEMNELTSVSTVSKGIAWAAGQYIQHFMQAGMPQGNPVVLRWDGKDWKAVPNQFDGTYINSVDAVSPGSASGAWIVGGYMGEGGGAASASRWSGTQWENVTLAKLGEVDSSGYSNVRTSALNGVVTLAPNDAWAVGSYSKDGPGNNLGNWEGHTLIEHWDGTVWREVSVASPNPEKLVSGLNAVAAISPTDLWAVGPGALILRYSGSGCASLTP